MGNIRVVQQWLDYDLDRISNDTGTALVGAGCNLGIIYFGGFTKAKFAKKDNEIAGEYETTDVRL